MPPKRKGGTLKKKKKKKVPIEADVEELGQMLLAQLERRRGVVADILTAIRQPSVKEIDVIGPCPPSAPTAPTPEPPAEDLPKSVPATQLLIESPRPLLSATSVQSISLPSPIADKSILAQATQYPTSLPTSLGQVEDSLVRDDTPLLRESLRLPWEDDEEPITPSVKDCDIGGQATQPSHAGQEEGGQEEPDHPIHLHTGGASPPMAFKEETANEEAPAPQHSDVTDGPVAQQSDSTVECAQQSDTTAEGAQQNDAVEPTPWITRKRSREGRDEGMKEVFLTPKCEPTSPSATLCAATPHGHQHNAGEVSDSLSSEYTKPPSCPPDPPPAHTTPLPVYPPQTPVPQPLARRPDEGLAKNFGTTPLPFDVSAPTPPLPADSALPPHLESAPP
eukprot:Sspe_Gene.12539::Locus_4279_Transcript_1_1_Confidence_1.000_Length_2386::g.12539::m.12539